jgi:uncharacterized protein (TIGR00369 family)
MAVQSVTTDLLEKVQAATMRAPFNRLVGLEVLSVNAGKAVLGLAFREELSQARGLLHGGVLATLADVALAVALLPTLHQGEHMATIELSIQYLRPVIDGMRVEAEARVLRRGKTVAVGEVDIRTDRGDLCAKSIMSYRIFRGTDQGTEGELG